MWEPSVRPVLERFQEKIEVTPGCWLWTAATHNGYGNFTITTGHHTPAHKYALELALGRPLAVGMRALHTCDTPACVRNDEVGFYEVGGVARHRRGHLFEGTALDNTTDMLAKGRGRVWGGAYPGERNHAAKLTEEQVLEIRRLHASGVTGTALAERYGVSNTNISYIVKRKKWAHI